VHTRGSMKPSLIKQGVFNANIAAFIATDKMQRKFLAGGLPANWHVGLCVWVMISCMLVTGWRKVFQRKPRPFRVRILSTTRDIVSVCSGNGVLCLRQGNAQNSSIILHWADRALRLAMIAAKNRRQPTLHA